MAAIARWLVDWQRGRSQQRHTQVARPPSQEAEATHRIQIYFADSHGGRGWTDSRHKRPISSIVPNPGVKEMPLNEHQRLLEDC
ncbi:hypothetical protein FIBSPDRAFT_876900 [Athelia psychrophila]|uniref:Uncharacterized protein n=1 Tax=Athelia psychrophila TaxID=1759441 RepID=A0A167WF50_9AGAM|nr:hypothetical protein FIBSPDRAFT_876900 [Fibularhizoctonia sp. CBS 109695]